MANNSNKKGIIDATSGEFIITDPSVGLLDTKNSYIVRTSSNLFEKLMSKAGVVANGTTDDYAAMQTAISNFQSSNEYDATMPPGVTVNLGTGIIMDIDKMQLNLRRSTLLGDAMTGAGSLISFTNSRNHPTSFVSPYTTLYNGVIMRNAGRDDSYTKNINGISLDSTSGNSPIAAINFRDLYIQGFKDGVNMGRNSYLILWDGCRFIRNWTGVASRNVTAGNKTNQGERMAFKGCTFANNFEHFYVEGEDWWMDLVSLDYPSVPTTGIPIGERKQRSMTIKYGAHVDIRRMSLEFRDNSTNSNDRSQIYIEDSDSSLVWDGGRLECSDGNGDNTGVVGNGSDGYQSYANLNSLIQVGGAGVGNIKLNNIRRGKSGIFASRKLISLRDTSTQVPRKVYVRGEDDPKGSPFVLGKSIAPILGDASEPSARTFGLLRRPTFDALPNEDLWCIYGTGGGILTGQNGRFTSTSFNVTQSGTTLTITKASNGSTAGRLMVLVPIEQGATLGWKFTANASITTTAVTSSVDYVNITPNFTSFLIVPQCNSIKSITRTTTLSLSATDATFNTHNYDSNTINVWDSGDRIAPPGATHARMVFNLDALDGSTTPFVMNLKNMTISAM